MYIRLLRYNVHRNTRAIKRYLIIDTAHGVYQNEKDRECPEQVGYPCLIIAERFTDGDE